MTHKLGCLNYSLPPNNSTFPYWVTHFLLIYRNNTLSSTVTCGTYGGGERCAQGFGGEAGGNETIGETQTKMGG
jgi:hypothetical protein